MCFVEEISMDDIFSIARWTACVCGMKTIANWLINWNSWNVEAKRDYFRRIRRDFRYHKVNGY